MKYLTSLFFILFLYSSCGQNEAIYLKHNPKNSLETKYNYTMDLDSYVIKTKLTKKCVSKKDTLFYSFKIDETVNILDGNSEIVPLDNTIFNLKTNNLGEFYYDSEDDFLFDLARINYSLYIIEFPKEKVTVGDEWNGKRLINDMIFKKIITKYVFLEEIDNGKILVGIEFKFDELKDTSFELQQKFSKKFEGKYIIDKITGEVIEANINIIGNAGFGDIKQKSTISIQRI